MKRLKSTYLAAVSVLLLPMAAQADLIQYQFTGADGGDGWTASGTLTFDSPDLTVAGDIASMLVAWSFEWTNGVETAHIDSDSGPLFEIFFEILGGGEVSFATFCTSPCLGAPGDGVNEFTSFFDLLSGISGWGAEIDATGLIVGFLPGSTIAYSGPTAVTEPGMLALLGLGLFGLGLARRRRMS